MGNMREATAAFLDNTLFSSSARIRREQQNSFTSKLQLREEISAWSLSFFSGTIVEELF